MKAFRLLSGALLLASLLSGCITDSKDDAPAAKTVFFFGPGEAVFRSERSEPESLSSPFSVSDRCDIRIRSTISAAYPMQPLDTLYRVEVDSTCWRNNDTAAARRTSSAYYIVKRGDTASNLWNEAQQNLGARAKWPFEIQARPTSETRRAAFGSDSVLAWGRRTGAAVKTAQTDTLLFAGLGLAKYLSAGISLNGVPRTSESITLQSWNGVDAPAFTCAFYAPDACPW